MLECWAVQFVEAAIAKSVGDFGSVDVKLVNVDDRYLARPKFTPLEERDVSHCVNLPLALGRG